MDNEAWSGQTSLREKEWGGCFRALLFASGHETTFILIFLLFPDQGQDSHFSCHWDFFSCEELQEKGCAWQWPFHYLCIEAAGECFEKAHSKVKMKEVVLPQDSSPAVKPYVFPVIKLVLTAIASLSASPWLLPSVQLSWGHSSKICSCPQPSPHIFICHTDSFPPDGSIGSRWLFVRASFWTPALK